MIYRNFQDIKLSGLGLGMMRLPVIDGDDSRVDEAAAAAIIDYAYQNGVNYFDTAWGYHGGNSELTAGKYLSKYPRDTYYLASKFPGYDNANMPKVKEIFERQLEKCQTPYFDFYLFHNVYEGNIDDYLNPKFGILDYLLAQKKNGRIKHLGFSAHGSPEVIRAFFGRLRPADGILPAAAELHGLAFPKRQGEGGTARKGRHSRVGHGTAAGWEAGQGKSRDDKRASGHAPGGNRARVGVPFSAGDPRCDHGAFRHVQHGATPGQYCYLAGGSAPDSGGIRPSGGSGGCGDPKRRLALYRLPLLHRHTAPSSCRFRN